MQFQAPNYYNSDQDEDEGFEFNDAATVEDMVDDEWPSDIEETGNADWEGIRLAYAEGEDGVEVVDDEDEEDGDEEGDEGEDEDGDVDDDDDNYGDDYGDEDEDEDEEV